MAVEDFDFDFTGGKTITKEKEIQNYKISVKDIKLVAKEVLGIEIMTENIKF